MAVYIVTGKLGNGKSLVCVGRIRDKLNAGCIVATNLDIQLQHLLGHFRKTGTLLRVPDKPTAEDLYAIGNGNLTYDESKNGLLVLDECGTWFNSRNWQDKTRGAVNDWFLHARKLGWDVMLIVQNVALIDSQARDAIAEHTVFCKRLDKLHIPFFGTLVKIISLGEMALRLPRVHVGKVVYGIKEDDVLSDRWVYRGNGLFACYDTKQAFLATYPHGLHSILPPWYSHGRYMVPRDKVFYMRLTKIVWKRFKAPFALAAGIFAGAVLASAVSYAAITRQSKPVVAAVAKVEPAKGKDEKKLEKPEKPVRTPAQIVLDQFASLRIVGALKSAGDNKFTYLLSPAKRGDNPVAVVNSREIIEAGVSVKYLSDCHALLSYKDAQSEVFCL